MVSRPDGLAWPPSLAHPYATAIGVMVRCIALCRFQSTSTGASKCRCRNWDQEILFLRDITDGLSHTVSYPPRTELERFVTMQRVSDEYDRTTRRVHVYLPTVSRDGFR